MSLFCGNCLTCPQSATWPIHVVKTTACSAQSISCWSHVFTIRKIHNAPIPYPKLAERFWLAFVVRWGSSSSLQVWCWCTTSYTAACMWCITERRFCNPSFLVLAKKHKYINNSQEEEICILWKYSWTFLIKKRGGGIM